MSPPPRKVLLTAVLLAPLALAYGYRKEDDPLLNGFKNAVAAARKGDWATAAAEVAKLDWQVDELREDLGVDLGDDLEAALASRRPGRLASSLANLVTLALLQKFHWNNEEGLADHDKAKARLYSAEAYYLDILDGNVRRVDDREGTTRSDRIREAFREAKKTLGSPGLFGAGARPADPAAFTRLTDGIADLLAESFPTFLRPR